MLIITITLYLKQRKYQISPIPVKFKQYYLHKIKIITLHNHITTTACYANYYFFFMKETSARILLIISEKKMFAIASALLALSDHSYFRIVWHF